MHIDQMSLENKLENNRRQYDELYILKEPIDTENKLRIDIQEVVDFCFCPYYYDLKYKDKKEINIKNLYDKSLHETFYAYLLALQQDTLTNTLEFLKYQFGKEWINYKKNKEYNLISSAMKRDSYNRKRKKGIDAIFKFNDLMNKDRQLPIIVNHKYEIEICKNIILTGTFEYVRELTLKDKQKVIQIVKFISESNRSFTNMARQNDLTLIAASYAFENLFDIDYFQSVVIDIEKGKATTSYYAKKEYELLKKTVESTVICMRNDIKCISPDFRCYNCEYRNVCIKVI